MSIINRISLHPPGPCVEKEMVYSHSGTSSQSNNPPSSIQLLYVATSSAFVMSARMTSYGHKDCASWKRRWIPWKLLLTLLHHNTQPNTDDETRPLDKAKMSNISELYSMLLALHFKEFESFSLMLGMQQLKWLLVDTQSSSAKMKTEQDRITWLKCKILQLLSECNRVTLYCMPHAFKYLNYY